MGKEPLPLAPPRAFSSPWYEIYEEDGPHIAYKVFKSEGIVNGSFLVVDQCPWKIIEEIITDQEYVIQYKDKHLLFTARLTDAYKDYNNWTLYKIKRPTFL